MNMGRLIRNPVDFRDSSRRLDPWVASRCLEGNVWCRDSSDIESRGLPDVVVIGGED